MVESRNQVERRSAIAALALLACALSACASSPDTDLNWPVISYLTITVHQGDTVSEIADRYNVAESTIVAMNGINSHNVIYPGEVLRVPTRSRIAASPSRPAYSAPHAAPRTAVVRNDVTPTPRPRPDQQTMQPLDTRPLVAVRSGEFVWPVEGRIITAFGTAGNGERNDGINIAATLGEPIHAAAAGTVTYAGNELKGYGNLVLIRHDDGYVTAYAHAESISVNRGDRVLKGQVIGYAGATGDVRSPQLHFEIRRGVEPVDPKPLLMASST